MICFCRMTLHTLSRVSKGLIVSRKTVKNVLKKLEAFLNVCILQSAPKDEGEQKMTIPKNVNKCSLVFAHPEVFVDDKNVGKMLKRKGFNMKVQAIVVEEAHLVQQW